MTQTQCNPNQPGSVEGAKPDLLSSFHLNGHPTHHLKRGDCLFRSGDGTRALYGVIAGVLRAERFADWGTEAALCHFSSGYLIVPPLQVVKPFAIFAVTAATVLCFKPALSQSAKNDPRLDTSSGPLTAHSASEFLAILAFHTDYSASDRLGAYLLALFDHNPLRAKGREMLELPRARRDIAGVLGVSLDALAQSMLDLQSCGALRVHSARWLELINRPRLEAGVLRHRRRIPL
ncbi:Crp/Fnr family transcriptional regulator [Leptospira interrogans]